VQAPEGDVSEQSVTAILVGYDDDPHDLLAAIRSLREQTVAPKQIICVDQSADGRFDRELRGAAPELELLRLEENIGYSSACNRAAQLATGDCLLFINPDAKAEPSCLEHLLGAIAGREDTAVAGAQVLLPDRHRVNAGDNVLHLSGLSWAGRYGLEVEDGPPRPAAVVSGAALLARRSAFEALGGYTDGFFMYYDDVDVAWRARLAGWEVLFCPEARVVHDYEFLKGNYKWRYLERNRWWCMLAYFELRTLVALVPLLLAVELAIWSRAISDGWAGAKLESYRALWADRRALYARRREVQRTRRIGDRAILERMSAGVDSPFLASSTSRRTEPLLRAYRRVLLRVTR
jgi:GT2 family glycosyltransferase